MGPPNDPPYWLNVSPVFAASSELRELKAATWLFSNRLPWNWLVPPLVMMLTLPDMVPAISAGAMPLVTEISWMASGLMILIVLKLDGMLRALYSGSAVALVPSTVMVKAEGAMP